MLSTVLDLQAPGEEFCPSFHLCHNAAILLWLFLVKIRFMSSFVKFGTWNPEIFWLTGSVWFVMFGRIPSLQTPRTEIFDVEDASGLAVGHP